MQPSHDRKTTFVFCLVNWNPATRSIEKSAFVLKQNVRFNSKRQRLNFVLLNLTLLS
jgi:hypothetical protein